MQALKHAANHTNFRPDGLADMRFEIVESKIADMDTAARRICELRP
jgi:hypothetical protein